MTRLAEDAQRILDAAAAAAPCSSMTILVAADGSIRMCSDPGWDLAALAAHHGARSVYRVAETDGVIRVEGRERSHSCVLEKKTENHIARLLLA